VAVRHTTVQLSKLLLYPKVDINIKHNLLYKTWADSPGVYRHAVNLKCKK